MFLNIMDFFSPLVLQSIFSCLVKIRDAHDSGFFVFRADFGRTPRFSSLISIYEIDTEDMHANRYGFSGLLLMQ